MSTNSWKLKGMLAIVLVSGVAIGAMSVQTLSGARKPSAARTITSAEPQRGPNPMTLQSSSPTRALTSVSIPNPPEALAVSTAPVQEAVAAQAGAADRTPVVSAVGMVQPQVLQAASPPPKTVAKVVEEPVSGMPPEIRDWLEHLYEIETSRRALASNGIIGLLETYGKSLAGLAQEASDEDSDPGHSHAIENLRSLAARCASMKADWAALERRLNSVPVPPECRTIDSYYTQSLTQTAQLIGQVGDICDRATGDPKSALNEAKGMVGQSSGKVDRPALRADAALTALFATYREKKWFDLEGDVGANLWGH